MERRFYLQIHVSVMAGEVQLSPSIRISSFLLLCCLISGALPGRVQAAAAGSDQGSSTTQQTKPHSGEDVFKANCGRCHNPPASLPPRITGTVIMHMRTRARLSRQDELLLLKYLAP